MPGFSFATMGRLGLTSPPYRFADMITNQRYYDPLRLPKAHLGFLHLSLSYADTLCALFLFVISMLCGTHTGGTSETFYAPGYFFSGIPLPVTHKETVGSPKFPDYPCRYMTWSQTPVVSLALVATWRTRFFIGNIHAILAHRTAAFHQIKSVGFLPDTKCRDYPDDHNYTFFGAQYRPCILDSHSFAPTITD